MSKQDSIRVRVSRPPRGAGDGRSGRPRPAEKVELELVTTQALNLLLASRNEIEKKAIEDIANTGEQGVLARDPQAGKFEIIDDADLQAILEDNDDLPKISRPSDATLVPLNESSGSAEHELSLVSTQALRQALGKPPQDDTEPETPQRNASYDPYNSV